MSVTYFSNECMILFWEALSTTEHSLTYKNCSDLFNPLYKFGEEQNF